MTDPQDYDRLQRDLVPYGQTNANWCPRRDSNSDNTFRKRGLYPLELRGREVGTH